MPVHAYSLLKGRPGLGGTPLVERWPEHVFSVAQAAYSLSFAPGKESVPVCEVRETGGGTTRDFLASELTDGTLEDFVGWDDGVISKWYDLTGNGHTLEDESGDNAGPKVVSAGATSLLVGKPCAKFYYTVKAYLDTIVGNHIPNDTYDVVQVVKVNQNGLLGNRARTNNYAWFALPQYSASGAYQGFGTQTYRRNGEDQSWTTRRDLWDGGLRLASGSVFTSQNVQNGIFGIGLGRPTPPGYLETSSDIAAMFIVPAAAGKTEAIESALNGHFGIY